MSQGFALLLLVLAGISFFCAWALRKSCQAVFVALLFGSACLAGGYFTWIGSYENPVGATALGDQPGLQGQLTAAEKGTTSEEAGTAYTLSEGEKNNSEARLNDAKAAAIIGDETRKQWDWKANINGITITNLSEGMGFSSPFSMFCGALALAALIATIVAVLVLLRLFVWLDSRHA
jgi:hypothetical protein